MTLERGSNAHKGVESMTPQANTVICESLSLSGRLTAENAVAMSALWSVADGNRPEIAEHIYAWGRNEGVPPEELLSNGSRFLTNILTEKSPRLTRLFEWLEDGMHQVDETKADDIAA